MVCFFVGRGSVEVYDGVGVNTVGVRCRGGGAKNCKKYIILYMNFEFSAIKVWDVVGFEEM